MESEVHADDVRVDAREHLGVRAVLRGDGEQRSSCDGRFRSSCGLGGSAGGSSAATVEE